MSDGTPKGFWLKIGILGSFLGAIGLVFGAIDPFLVFFPLPVEPVPNVGLQRTSEYMDENWKPGKLSLVGIFNNGSDATRIKQIQVYTKEFEEIPGCVTQVSPPYGKYDLLEFDGSVKQGAAVPVWVKKDGSSELEILHKNLEEINLDYVITLDGEIVNHSTRHWNGFVFYYVNLDDPNTLLSTRYPAQFVDNLVPCE